MNRYVDIYIYVRIHRYIYVDSLEYIYVDSVDIYIYIYISTCRCLNQFIYI